jgi:type IV fimbrial biogenesis protein FimT
MGAMRNVSALRRYASMRSGTGGERGVTLIELLVTLSVAAVIIAIAIPNFRALTISNKLTTAAGDVVIAINAARMEAIKNNGSVQFCSDSLAGNTTNVLGTLCGTSAGAVVAMIAQDDGTRSATPLRDAIPSIGEPLKLKGGLKALRFNGQGLAFPLDSSALFGGTVVDICTDSLSTNNHRIISMVGGTVLQTKSDSGACTS